VGAPCLADFARHGNPVAEVITAEVITEDRAELAISPGTPANSPAEDAAASLNPDPGSEPEADPAVAFASAVAASLVASAAES